LVILKLVLSSASFIICCQTIKSSSGFCFISFFVSSFDPAVLKTEGLKILNAFSRRVVGIELTYHIPDTLIDMYERTKTILKTPATFICFDFFFYSRQGKTVS
jgi:hypothetical protein